MAHHEESMDFQKLKGDAVFGIATCFIAVLVIATIVLSCNQ